MKQAKATLPSGEYLIVNAPFYTKETMAEFNKNWKLLGADPTNLTEEEAGEIVEGYGIGRWRNYKVGSQYEEYLMKTATASLDSLAASLGISKPFVVLKNINHGV